MFSLGAKSLRELEGVHPALVDIVHIAIQRTPIDFSVHDGIRTLDEQREYVRTGASQTLKSKHLFQPDGYGHAVDLVPYINGMLRWEWVPLHKIAAVMRTAARQKGVQLIWGGVWDIPLNDIKGPLDAAVAAYVARRKRLGKKAFIDGPHFELRLV